MSSKWVGDWWKKNQKTKGVGSACTARRKLVEVHRLFGVDGASWSSIPLHYVFTSAATAKWGRKLGKFDVLPNNVHRHMWSLQIVKQLVREGEASAPSAARLESAIKARARLVRKVLRNGGLVKVPAAAPASPTSTATGGARQSKEGPWARYFLRLDEHQSKTVSLSICRFCLAAHTAAPNTVPPPCKVPARRASQVPHLKRCEHTPQGQTSAEVDAMLSVFGTFAVPYKAKHRVTKPEQPLRKAGSKRLRDDAEAFQKLSSRL